MAEKTAEVSEVSETPSGTLKADNEEKKLSEAKETVSIAEYKNVQRALDQRLKEIDSYKNRITLLERQGQDSEAIKGELEDLRLEVLGLRDAYDGISQTTEEDLSAAKSRVAKFQAERAARAQKTLPQSMTEPERAAETIRALVKKAKIEPTDPMLASVSETWNAGDFTGAVEEARMLTNNIISTTKALEEEGLSLSSDEAKEVREALKAGNPRKINRAMEKLIDKKVAEGNAAVEAENERKAGFKVNTVPLRGGGTQSLEDLKKVDTRGMSLEELAKHKAAYKAALNRR